MHGPTERQVEMPPTPKSDAGLSSPGMHRRDGQTGAQRRGGPEARSQHRIADRATASRCVPLGGEIRLGSRCLAPSELRVGVRARRARTRTGGAAICTCLVPLGQHVLQRPTRCTGIGGKKVSRIFRIHDRITISYSFPIWLGYAASFLFSREHSKICPSHRFVTGVRFTLLRGGRAHRSQAGPASCDMPLKRAIKAAEDAATTRSDDNPRAALPPPAGGGAAGAP